MSGRKQKKRAKVVLIQTILIIAAAITLLPIIWIIILSLKTNQEIVDNPFSLPKVLQFGNYVKAWITGKMGKYSLNSIFYTACSLALTEIVSSMAAYTIARLKVKGSQGIFCMFMSGIMIPIASLIVPIYMLIMNMNLLDTRIGIILVYSTFTIPMTVMLISAGMRNIPQEIEDAAVMDGCGILEIFTRIMLPLCKPIISTTVILNFMTYWNEFFFAMTLTTQDKLRTLPVGLANFQGQYQTDYAPMAAGMVIVVIPMVLIFILMQEKVVAGVTAGAVKG